MPNLNDRHYAALRYIRKFYQEHGYPATIREIGKNIGVDSTSLVTYYLSDLEDAHLITRSPRIARSIVITDLGIKELTGTQTEVRIGG